MSMISGVDSNNYFINNITRLVARGNFPTQPDRALHKLVEALVGPREEKVVMQGPVASIELQSGHVICPAFEYDQKTSLEFLLKQIAPLTLGFKGTPYERDIVFSDNQWLGNRMLIKDVVKYDMEGKPLPLTLIIIKTPFHDERYKMHTILDVLNRECTKDQLERITEISFEFKDVVYKKLTLDAVIAKYIKYEDFEIVEKISLESESDSLKENALKRMVLKITTVEHFQSALKIVLSISDLRKRSELLCSILQEYLKKEEDIEKGFEIIYQISDCSNKEKAIQIILPKLTTEEYLERSLDIALTINDKFYKVKALSAIAQKCTNEKLFALLQKTQDKTFKKAALEAMIPKLNTIEDLKSVFNIARILPETNKKGCIIVCILKRHLELKGDLLNTVKIMQCLKNPVRKEHAFWLFESITQKSRTILQDLL